MDKSMISNGRDLLKDMGRRPVEAARQAQEVLLDASQQSITRWCARREKAADAAAQYGRALINARSPQDLMEAWIQWATGAAGRLAQAAEDQTEAGVAIARGLGKGPLSEVTRQTAFGDKGNSKESPVDARKSRLESVPGEHHVS